MKRNYTLWVQLGTIALTWFLFLKHIEIAGLIWVGGAWWQWRAHRQIPYFALASPFLVMPLLLASFQGASVLRSTPFFCRWDR